MANYSTDSEMQKIDNDIMQWLGDRENYNDIRNIVTARMNSHLKKCEWWQTLKVRGLLTEDGLVDKDKVLNPEDFEDLENTWVREILYKDNAVTAALAEQAHRLHKGRVRMLNELVVIADTDSDDIADSPPVKVKKIHRS